MFELATHLGKVALPDELHLYALDPFYADHTRLIPCFERFPVDTLGIHREVGARPESNQRHGDFQSPAHQLSYRGEWRRGRDLNPDLRRQAGVLTN